MDNATIGFTGTRSGMTDMQKEVVTRIIKGFLEELTLTGLHGDCVGADEDFHNICRKADFKVLQRPCTFVNLRANTDAVAISEPTNPMARNQEIVNDCTFLLACPPTQEELQRSGTWATIRMGRRAKKQVIIVYPDGSVVEDAPGPLEDVVDA